MAREKAREANWGSPFRFHLTRMLPAAIAAHCPKIASVLDVGCGSGRYAYFFIEAGIEGSYLGVDLNPRLKLGVQLPQRFSGVVQTADAHELSALNQQFDFAVSITAFEHFKDDHKAAAELASVLKPGAKALIVVPSKYSYPLYGRHGFRRYNPGDVRALGEKTGLKMIHFEKVGGLPGFLFHFLWFAPAHLLRLLGKTLFYGAFALNKNKARTALPGFAKFLDDLGNHHLKWGLGRRVHRALLSWAARGDRYLPFAEAGYLAVFERTAGQ